MMKQISFVPRIKIGLAAACLLAGCSQVGDSEASAGSSSVIVPQQNPEVNTLPKAHSYGEKLAQAAINIIDPSIVYDPAYVALDYPGGDVPPGKGVCADVVIRCLRKLGTDLQRAVHEDMKENFSAYPQIWGLKYPDRNIDHRRVPNLMKYFERKGYALAITANGKDYLPGDIVAWRLSNGMTHIGIVSNKPNAAGNHYQIVHNIGRGQVHEDVLFSYTIIGHYRIGEH